MLLQEITKGLVKTLLNDGKIYVYRIIDGTAETVSEFIYRYKFPTKKGYYRDKEERVVIVENNKPMFGWTSPQGQKLGTELIDVRIANPDDKRVFWVEDPVFFDNVVDRDPVTKRPIIFRSLVKGAGIHRSGTYQEFLDVVNAGGNGKPELPESPQLDDITEMDDEWIKANYETLTDEEMGKHFNIDAKIMKDYRIKTLGLKKKPFGGK